MTDTPAVVAAVMLLGQVLSPIIFPMFFWFMPANPAFVGSLFVDKNSTGLKKFPFFIFEIWMFTQLFGCVFFFGLTIILELQCLLCYIKVIRLSSIYGKYKYVLCIT